MNHGATKAGRLFLGIVSAGLIGGITGCSTNDATTEADFIREGPIQQQPLTTRGAALFPVHPKNVWHYTVLDPNGKEHSEEFRFGAARTQGKSQIMPLQSLRQGKVVRQEVFQVRAAGVSMAATGSRELMTIYPPIPVLKFPVTEGACYEWSGKIRLQNVSIPATGLTRISAWEPIITRKGEKIEAYRVDTLISSTLNDRRIDFPSFHWFAPGIGIIRQKYLAGGNQIVKTVTDYSIQPVENFTKKSEN